MSKFSLKSKKGLILILVLVLIGGGIAGYFYWSGKKDSDKTSANTQQPEPKEKPVDDVVTYLTTDGSLSGFQEYMTGYDVSAKVAEYNSKSTNGSATLVAFAVTDDFFDESEDAKKLADVPAALTDDIRGYYYAVFYPKEDGSAPDLTLTDGERITMFNGRDLTFKKTGSRITAIDAKGRSMIVDSQYYVDKNGNRLYILHDVLLLQ